MSLFGSLYTAVGGLAAQSQATAIISNNIANVNTTGFKRSEAAFASLVTVESYASRYSPGSVQVNRMQQVGQQGQIAQTGSATDVAISGDGFLAVKSTADERLLEQEPFSYTRNGQFFEDNEGILTNSAGMKLYGWPVDDAYSDIDIDDNTSYNADLSVLEPVNVLLPSGKTEPTNLINLAVNLDADESATMPNVLNGLIDPLSNLPDYSRTIRTYDSLGKSHDVVIEMRRTYGPAATEISNSDELDPQDLLINGLGFADGETIDVQVGGGPLETYTVRAAQAIPPIPGEVSTIGELIAEMNDYNNGAVGPEDKVHAFLNNDGALVITANDYRDTAATQQDLTLGGTGITRLGFVAGVTPPSSGDGATPGTLPPFNTDETATDDATYPTLQNVPGNGQYNADGWWQIDVVSPEFGSSMTTGLINFNNDGSINAVADSDKNIDIELKGINWDNGDAELQDINIDIRGFTQYSGPYNVAYSNQNGSELGLKTSIDIDSEGYVNARFSNGTSSRIYKLPIVTFASQEQLQEISTTSYRENSESGTPLIQEAGVGRAGILENSALEQSNVDLADEFTKLIVTQRAYSANTKVITTVDQMTEDLLRLR